jgi:hypothetical protein
MQKKEKQELIDMAIFFAIVLFALVADNLFKFL